MKILIREIDENLAGEARKAAILEAENGMLRDVLLQAWLLRDADGELIGAEDMASRESQVAREAADKAPLPEIARTEQGKPYLLALPQFHYNISHSGKFVALAATYPDTNSITPSDPAEIGIDIQQRGTLRSSIDALAARYYTEQEAAFLAHFDESVAEQAETKERLFYTFWSIKEAYLKCMGTGLPGGMASFDMVPSQDYKDAGVIKDRESGKVTARYLILTPPDPAYVMAVCVAVRS